MTHGSENKSDKNYTRRDIRQSNVDAIPWLVCVHGPSICRDLLLKLGQTQSPKAAALGRAGEREPSKQGYRLINSKTTLVCGIRSRMLVRRMVGRSVCGS